MAHAIDVSEKLNLTAIALGCLTRKELCAAFFQINPNTVLSLQNCYNWLGGRSTPRSFSFYEDWALVLDLDEGPHFIMTSTLAAFAERVAARMNLPDAMLASFGDTGRRSSEVEPRPELVEGQSASWLTKALLQGSYLALSLAWAPTARGRLLQGALHLATSDEGKLQADYLETILGRKVLFEGHGQEQGHTAQLTLTCQANATTFFMALHLPILPGNLGAGIFAGNTVYDSASTPAACPILFIRNHALSREEVEAGMDYLDASAEALARLLKGLGYGRDPTLAAENALLDLLTQPPDIPLITLQREALTHAATLVDKRRLDAQ
ncbi:MAG: hypothetical protein ACQETX_06550 [Pseudomonadota bacterium]